MLFRLAQESELIEDYQVYNMVSACIDRLEGGVQFCLLLYLLFCLANNNIIDIVQVSFIHIFIPRFLADGFGNVILLKVGHIFICLENA